MDRLCGILLHPTSLPSPYGIGDLGKCAYDFVDFLTDAKQSLWQVLPLVPTSIEACNSPYQSYSAFAGNHLLISPDILLDEGFLTTDDLNEIPEFTTDKVDYDNVVPYKTHLFKKAFERFILCAPLSVQNEFEEFCHSNKYWLDDYALFISIKNKLSAERKNEEESGDYSALKEKYQDLLTDEVFEEYYENAVFCLWPDKLLKREQTELNKYTNLLHHEIEYTKFLQFTFFSQWTKLKEYANENGIKIIGDLPIFADYDSADVWAQPENYQLDSLYLPESVAGVPPDYFSETGQLWGSPLYRWDYHKKNGYNFWSKKIQHIMKMVDIVRIDHFRGFESYYSIPFGEKTAINGKWVKGPGEHLFLEISKKLGNVPIIAEDLGIITSEVTALRESLGFPGMKILQFAFETDSTNDYLPHNYQSSNFVVYTGTHDNNTTLGWYTGASEEIKDFFRRYLNVDGENAHWDMIRMAYSSCAKWAVIPLQDILMLGENHRMNVPGVAKGNWSFRFTKEMDIERYAQGLRYLKTLFNR